MVSGISKNQNWENILVTAPAAAAVKEGKVAAMPAPLKATAMPDGFDKGVKAGESSVKNDVCVMLSAPQKSATIAAPKNQYEVNLIPDEASKQAKLNLEAEARSARWGKVALGNNPNNAFYALPAAAQEELLSLLDRLDNPLAICKLRDAFTADASAISPQISALITGDIVASLAEDELKAAFLTEVQTHPGEHTINTLSKLTKIDWFNNMNLEGRKATTELMAKLADLSQKNPGSMQHAIVENTINRILSGDIVVTFDIPDEMLSSMIKLDENGDISDVYGVGGKIIDDKMTICISSPLHIPVREVVEMANRLINKNAITGVEAIQAEYRSWFVGFVAENGTQPTKKDAVDWFTKFTTERWDIMGRVFDSRGELNKFVNFAASISDADISVLSGSLDVLGELPENLDSLSRGERMGVITITARLAADLSNLKDPNASAPIPQIKFSEDLDN